MIQLFIIAVIQVRKVYLEEVVFQFALQGRIMILMEFVSFVKAELS